MQHLLTSLNQEKASLTSMTNIRTFIQAIGAIRWALIGERTHSIDAPPPSIL